MALKNILNITFLFSIISIYSSMITCPNGQLCPVGTNGATCCPTSDGYMCCPYVDATCCSSKYCCPYYAPNCNERSCSQEASKIRFIPITLRHPSPEL